MRSAPARPRAASSHSRAPEDALEPPPVLGCGVLLQPGRVREDVLRGGENRVHFDVFCGRLPEVHLGDGNPLLAEWTGRAPDKKS